MQRLLPVICSIVPLCEEEKKMAVHIEGLISQNPASGSSSNHQFLYIHGLYVNFGARKMQNSLEQPNFSLVLGNQAANLSCPDIFCI